MLFVVYIFIGVESMLVVLVEGVVLSVISLTAEHLLRLNLASAVATAAPKFNIKASSSLFDVEDQ